MTVQDEIRQRIEKDALLARLRKKIDSGKGTYADSFAYSDRAGKLLGEIFSRRLPDIPLEEREALCVELLRDRYTDINALCDRVQKALDEAQGLHLAPQHAPFNGERAHQIGSSLRDLSKSVETLQRRAESAPATATRAMHDDRMKTEAKFRSRAGLNCFITRKAVFGCCAWCTAMAGRYAYGEEPDDIYRRHDNCDCTVTFENGRKRQDVWSKREWEAPEPGAGAGDPVVFTKEQAEALQAEHGLTFLRKKGIIKAITVDDVIKAGIKGEGTDSIIHEDVAKAIIDTITSAKKAGGKFDFDDVRLVSISPKEGEGLEVFRTNAVDRYGYPHVILEINEYAIGGLTKEQADLLFFMAENTACNSVEDGILHEIGHAKVIYGRTYANYERISDELEEKHIEGVSVLAKKDGLECIAECEVRLKHVVKIPKEARELYELYTSGGG